MSARPTFPAAFQCYKPLSERVYGCICMSPCNTILLVKGRRTHKWSFPKGHRIGCESYLKCALRETLEETGVDLSGQIPVAYHKLSVGEYFFFEVAEELETHIRDAREVMETSWVSIENMRSMKCNVDVNKFLHYMRRSGFPTDRTESVTWR